MPHQLTLNAVAGAKEYLTLLEPIDLFTPSTFYFEADLRAYEALNLLSDGININILEVGNEALNRTTRLKRGGHKAYWYRKGLPDTDDFYTFGLEKIDADTYELFIDGQSIGQTVEPTLDDATVLLNTIARSYNSYYHVTLRRMRLYDSRGGTLQRDYDPSASVGLGYLADTVSGHHAYPQGISDFDSMLEYYDDGSSEPEPQPELHEFSGSALVNASITASTYKTVSLAGNAQVSALSQSSLSKLTEFSGQSTVNISSVSLFEKVTTYTGTATVDVASQSDFSKRVAFSGESTVNVTANGVLFDENFELHTFAGGATISATASGQAIKVGLVSGESSVNATTTAQAQKVAALSGNAQVAASSQSAFSKLASLAGNAISRITMAARSTKQVLLNGASTVLARVSGTFFNTESNVETYETIIQGRVKAPLVAQGTIKSLTIQGRVK